MIINRSRARSQKRMVNGGWSVCRSVDNVDQIRIVWPKFSETFHRWKSFIAMEFAAGTFGYATRVFVWNEATHQTMAEFHQKAEEKNRLTFQNWISVFLLPYAHAFVESVINNYGIWHKHLVTYDIINKRQRQRHTHTYCVCVADWLLFAISLWLPTMTVFT